MLALVLAIVLVAAPVGATLVAFRRWADRQRARLGLGDLAPRRSARSVLTTLAFGAAAGAVAFSVDRALLAWMSSGERPPGKNLLLLYGFVVASPLGQGLKVAAVTPVWRTRRHPEPFDGVLYAAAAGVGFVSTWNGARLAILGPSSLELARAALAVPAQAFFAGAWGYALSRERHRTLGGRRFNLLWGAATLFGAVYDHMLYQRGATALLGTVPLLFVMGLVTAGALRDLARRAEPGAPRTRRLLVAPPSLTALREALTRSERPVMPTWIGFGALVTTGLITTALTGAVALGNRLGFDFAAVDRGGGLAATTPPLLLLGTAVLAAFSTAGYLIARASRTKTVLEPAMSAAVAIVGALILLGLAAPVAVVFAVALSPVAFGFACAGAWVALQR